ncbi:MAG: hypothetical protein LBJ36_12075 [Synergistaceae bacterium]|jgi:hypothetical protein|nr:hypothetical protein [Synergistaceae bacterium]
MKSRTTRRLGFTLVEILMTMTLSATVGLIVIQIIQQILFMTTKSSNYTLAWERGQNVLSILDPRISHVAFGIPYERVGDLFQKSFGGVPGKNDGPPPSKWSDRGPVQIWRGKTLDSPSLWDLAPETDGVHRGRGLAVLYAVPSALTVKLAENIPLPMDAGVTVTIKLTPKENLERIGDRLPTTAKNDMRSWVTFPLTGLPLYTSKYSNSNLTMRIPEGSGLSSTLYPYDELHYLRAERFQVKDSTLYSEELYTSWTTLEPLLEGVLEMWFEWMPSERRVEAWILATGGGVSFGKSSRPEEWPTTAPWRAEFEQHDMVVVRKSWLLENL